MKKLKIFYKNLQKDKIYEDFLSSMLLLILGIYYYKAFGYMPISEDTGFYGFLSKCISNGSILHVDIPVATNSISLYIIGGVMHFFDASIKIIRLYYLFFNIGLILVVYFIIKKEFSTLYAFSVSLITFVLINIPHIILDLGRNSIVVSLFFIFLGIYIYFSNYKYKFYSYGFLLGMAAINRETFLIIVIVVTLDFIFQIINRKILRNNVLNFFIGILIAFSINAIILTIYGNWLEYIHDMLHLGASFRYSQGFFSIERIKGNILPFIYGYENFYSSVVFLSLIAYTLKTEKKIINYIKFILLPAFLIEAVIINKSCSYSIQPLLVVFSILSIHTIVEFILILEKSIHLENKFIFIGIVFIFMGGDIKNILIQYQSYKDTCKLNKDNKIPDTDPYRLLDVINRIKHESISTHSQYPLLFLSNQFYKPSLPAYIEDLSASANLGSETIWKSSMQILKDNPSNILVDKTTGEFSSKWTELGKIIYDNYIEIAKFSEPKDNNGVMAPYFDRIFISKKYFEKSFKKIGKTSIVLRDNINKNKNNYPIVVKITTQNPLCSKGIIVTSALSSIKYDINTYSDSNISIYSFVLPNNQYVINSSEANCKEYTVQEFVQVIK